MSSKISYGDLFKLFEKHGFERVVEGTHVLYQKRPGKAALYLPLYQPEVEASPIHRAMVKFTLVDFGIMSEDEFERWAENPRRFKAA